MLKLNIKAIGLEAITRDLDNQRKQARFATAQALTRTAWAVVRAEQAEVDKVFDKPTPFTKRAFGVERATPQSLTAVVYIKPRQAEYLAPQIEGGSRPMKRFEQRLSSEAKSAGFWVPGKGVKLNAYGNLTLGQLKSIAEGLRKSGKFADTFVGIPRGHAGAPFGIWARPKHGKAKGVLKPLLVRISQPGYRRRFDFFGVAERTVDRNFATEFDKAMESALRSAR